MVVPIQTFTNRSELIFLYRLRQVLLVTHGAPDPKSWSDKDGFELTIKSGGKERIFTISDAQSIKDPEAEIELLINQIGDNE